METKPARTPADIIRLYRRGIAQCERNLTTARDAFALAKQFEVGNAGLEALAQECLTAEARLEKMQQEYRSFCEAFGLQP